MEEPKKSEITEKEKDNFNIHEFNEEGMEDEYFEFKMRSGIINGKFYIECTTCPRRMVVKKNEKGEMVAKPTKSSTKHKNCPSWPLEMLKVTKSQRLYILDLAFILAPEETMFASPKIVFKKLERDAFVFQIKFKKRKIFKERNKIDRSRNWERK